MKIQSSTAWVAKKKDVKSHLGVVRNPFFVVKALIKTKLKLVI